MLLRILILSLLTILVSCTPNQKKDENILHAFVDSDIPHLDPMHSVMSVASVVNASIFEGLYHYHYLKRPLVLEPLVADSMPEISNSGQTYKIKIKKGVMFQDDPAFKDGKGRELTANDFIFSWKRLADPKNKALGWWAIDGLIEGLNQWRDDMRTGKANYDTPVSGLQAPDDHTLIVKLTRKSYQFNHILAMPVMMAVAKEVVDKYGKEIVNHPVGTGPFRLKKWTRSAEVHLVKNKNYRKDFYPVEGTALDKELGRLKTAGKQLPLTDEVRVKIVTERQPLWLLFLKGQLDFAIIPKDNNAQVLKNGELVPEMSKKGIRIHKQHRPDVMYIGLNMEHPVLGKHKKLRQAMAITIDKEIMKKNFYSNRGTIAQGPIPPGLDGYDSTYKNDLQFNRSQAKKLLTEAGFPGGKGLPTFNFEMANSGPFSRQVGEFLKDQFAQIGVKIKLSPNTWPQFNQKIKNKKADIFFQAWMADYPDSENFLQLFYSKNVSPGSNNANFINRDFDALYDQMVQLPEGPERNKVIGKMVRFVNDEVPSIFILHRSFRLPYHGWLQNYNEFPVIFDYHKYLGVDQKKKQELLRAL